MKNLRSVEKLAEEVVESFGFSKPPIDPFHIARLEKIKLLPGQYIGRFDGRIEYRRKGDTGKFYLLYYEDEATQTEGRIRFSVAHELGHFYIPTHREYLISGGRHSSHTGFVSDDEMELEADLFAASLLMPEKIFEKHVNLKRGNVCNLQELVDLASRIFMTSITSTVIRYVQLCFEPCCVILSKDSKVLYSIPSEDMRIKGYDWIRRGSCIPATSITGIAINSLGKGGNHPFEGSIDADVWFEGRPAREMWEESKILGKTGLTLSLLSLDE